MILPGTLPVVVPLRCCYECKIVFNPCALVFTLSDNKKLDNFEAANHHSQRNMSVDVHTRVSRASQLPHSLLHALPQICQANRSRQRRKACNEGGLACGRSNSFKRRRQLRRLCDFATRHAASRGAHHEGILLPSFASSDVLYLQSEDD